MTINHLSVQFLGSEKVKTLEELLVVFGLPPNLKDDLVSHLHDIFRRQNLGVAIELVEFLNEPKCNMGGMQIEDQPELIRPQTLNVPLELRVVLRSDGGTKYELNLELVLNCVGLDSAPSLTTDMFVKAQRAI